ALPGSRRPHARARAGRARRAGELRGPRGGRDVSHAATRGGHGGDGPRRRQALDLVRDARCRSLPDPARVLAEHGGGALPGPVQPRRRGRSTAGRLRQDGDDPLRGQAALARAAPHHPGRAAGTEGTAMTLDDARIEKFLAGKQTVVLATVQPDGSPLATAMWL